MAQGKLVSVNGSKVILMLLINSFTFLSFENVTDVEELQLILLFRIFISDIFTK